ncbi:cytochrome P450 family protein [Dictyobacter aurantiacus]|uniref:Polyketide biosynthesis cytochrome P450 PksS n=1 Tax=Dictyobacter aurantiacus TaxID=1936993 RepID=A0A401ZLJ1_9CHLR|nr:cytochrome P450 [Dictyobacter aurantiacus]GCE07684.1 polyketide biosynthesis cytochrome P450 PksS [Dictyobacter aurantiacus]
MSQSTDFDLTSSQTAEFDLTTVAFKSNPYPILARLRTHDPVYQYTSSPDGQSTWLITRYEDAEIVLRDERFVKDKQSTLPPEERAPSAGPAPSVSDLFDLGMLKFDPPDHTRLRKVVNLFFTPRATEQWRESVQRISDELIDKVESQKRMDLIEDFASVLPIRIISEMLGVPAEDSMQLHLWTKRIADALDDPAAFEQVASDLQAFYTYLLALVEKKRQASTDDLVCKLMHASVEGDQLTERELVAMIFLLILAGHETTTNLIGNGILALLTHPEQKQLLQAQPELIKPAIEEFLRYLAPFTITTHRWAREDVEMRGKLIRHGDAVLVSLAATNRDENKFDHPDTLDITRQENPHIAFGKGVHYCLGAPLARLEGQIAINTLLRRLPAMQLDIEPEALVWRTGSTVLGVNHLPVTF